jgi:hypothetical protein
MKKLFLVLGLSIFAAVPILQVACSSKTSPSAPTNSGPTSTITNTPTVTLTATVTPTPTATTCSNQGSNDSTNYGSGNAFTSNNDFNGIPFTLSASTSLSQINARIWDVHASATNFDVYELAVAKIVSGQLTYVAGAGGAVTLTANQTATWDTVTLSSPVSLASGTYVAVAHVIEHGTVATNSGTDFLEIAFTNGTSDAYYGNTGGSSLLSSYSPISPSNTGKSNLEMYVSTCP